ncbi:cache domain-containing protein [Ruminococcaceae bacterium OttesenSCG-928-L11]|nr:cache domain-containing protein [Ruminococcaceae bacterium OttesenSCG-928-L11]
MAHTKRTGRKSATRKVFINFLISYVAIFTLPIFLVFAMYHHISTRILNEEIDSARLAAVSQFKKSFEEDLARSRAIASYLWQNEELPLLYGKTEETFRPADVLAMLKISRALSYYTGTNPFISDIYLRLNKSGRIITMQGAKPGADYFAELRTDLGYEDWVQPMEEYSAGRLIARQSSQHSLEQDLYYMQSMPILPVGNTDAMLVIKLSHEWMFKAAPPNAVLCVLDESGRLLAGSGGAYSAHDFESLSFAGDRGFVRDQEMIISYVKADSSPLTLISIIPERYFTRRLEDVQRMTYVILSVCILAGTLLTHYFITHNYNPIKQLLSLVPSQPPGPGGKKDPYWEIRAALLDATDEKITRDMRARQKQAQRKRSELARLLCGPDGEPDRIARLAEETGLAAADGPFRVIHVEPIDCGTFFYDFSGEGEELLQPLAICETIYTEMLGEAAAVDSLIHEGRLLLVVATDDSGLPDAPALHQAVATAQQFIRDNYSIDTYGAASAVHRGVSRLTAATREAEEAMQYLGIAGHKSFLLYDDFHRKSGTAQMTPVRVREEAQFTGSLRAGDFARSAETLDAMVAAYLSDKAWHPQILRLQLHALLRDTLEAIDMLNIPGKDALLEETRICQRILQCGNLAEFRAEMADFLAVMIEHTGKSEYDDTYIGSCHADVSTHIGTVCTVRYAVSRVYRNGAPFVYQ